jgi:hypothetical protein
MLIIEAIGLEGVMKKINTATGGQISEMARLIPNVQALSAGLALLAQDGDMYKNSLDEINNSFATLNDMYFDIAGTSDFARRKTEAYSEAIDRSFGKTTEGTENLLSNMVNLFKSVIFNLGNTGKVVVLYPIISVFYHPL